MNDRSEKIVNTTGKSVLAAKSIFFAVLRRSECASEEVMMTSTNARKTNTVLVIVKKSMRVMYGSFGRKFASTKRYAINVSIELAAMLSCGPVSDGSIQKADHDMHTISIIGMMTCQK